MKLWLNLLKCSCSTRHRNGRRRVELRAAPIPRSALPRTHARSKRRRLRVWAVAAASSAKGQSFKL
eukprot:6109779-Pleurochrysis_carterae.AAC.1